MCFLIMSQSVPFSTLSFPSSLPSLAPSPLLPPPPAEPYVLVWSAQNAKEKLENLLVIRTSFLAPFLFGEQTFCDEVQSSLNDSKV